MQKNNQISVIFVGIILIACCMFSSQIFAATQKISRIYVINSFDVIKQQMNMLKKEDMVIFDVDGVLLIEQDAIFGVRAENKAAWQKLFKVRLDCLTNEHLDYIYSIVRHQSTCVLIDQTIHQFITSLQEKGVKTIALTATRIGRYGIIDKMEDWRLNQLASLGIDFSSSFPSNDPLKLFLPETDRDNNANVSRRFALAKKGIIFTGDYSKGDALKAFLAEIQFTPKHIVFIDDNKSYLESVEEVCRELGIEFNGFYFT